MRSLLRVLLIVSGPLLGGTPVTTQPCYSWRYDFQTGDYVCRLLMKTQQFATGIQIEELKEENRSLQQQLKDAIARIEALEKR